MENGERWVGGGSRGQGREREEKRKSDGDELEQEHCMDMVAERRNGAEDFGSVRPETKL